MKRKAYLVILGVLVGFFASIQVGMGQDTERIRWYSVDAQKNVQIFVYLFYSDTCSHCQQALKFSDSMESKYPWILFKRYETTRYRQNLDFYREMAGKVGRVAGQVPAFFYCGQLEIGFDSPDRAGKRLEAAFVRCHDALTKQLRKQSQGEDSQAALNSILLASLVFNTDQEMPEIPLELPAPDTKIDLPWRAEVDVSEASLPFLTVAIAGCDAFNPCAFFVLLFLLSLMVHAHSRVRMLLVGGIFVLASGVVYFLFMAAWLNLFFIAGHLKFITIGAGLLAAAIALVNIKDYFWFKQGVSLSIPDQAKPGLFQRMTTLVGEKRLLGMIAGTVVLAGITNLYELLCTSGFPMVYTRILTLRELPQGAYYSYLALYNVVYVLPLALIVVAFTFTLGSRKLTEKEGRILKLLSGLMMLALGVLLVVAPEMMTSVSAAIGMLALSIGLTAVIVVAERWLTQAKDREVAVH